MSANFEEWTDVFTDEDNGLPVPAATEDLPDDNEEKGEDNGQDSEAAGALSEDDDPSGMKDVPNGEDEISGTKSTEYDDTFLSDKWYNEDDKDQGEENGSDNDNADKDGATQGEDDDKSDDEGDKDEDDTKDEYYDVFVDTGFIDEEGGLPLDPVKEDLPNDNEKEGEDNGQGSEAAGALSEDDTDPGMKDVPTGEDEITGTKSTGYDDMFIDNWEDKDDEESDDEGSDDDKSDDAAQSDEGSDDKGDDKGGDDDSEDKDTKDEYTNFEDFFVNSVGEETPDADGADANLEPADPVDGNGKKISPTGDPDLPSNLTEPVLVPADDPDYPNDTKTKDEFRQELGEDERFGFFGDF
jgi:hypothetical protein